MTINLGTVRGLTEHLRLGRHATQVPEAERRQQQHQTGADEGHDACDECDLTHLPEAVGVQEHPAKGLAHEQRLPLLSHRRVVRVLRVHGDECTGDLAVGLAAGDLGQVNLDVVVGEHLSLLAVDHVLAGVRRHVLGDLRALLRGDTGLAGEVDLLLCELGLDVVLHEAVGPEAKRTNHDEYGCDDQTTGRDQGVECLAAHCRLLPPREPVGSNCIQIRPAGGVPNRGQGP